MDTYRCYTRSAKLDVTLLPKWVKLHVSKIFSPAILAGDKQLGSYKEIFYTDHGKLQKRVILLGEAGRGKTTFCKHLTDTWLGSMSSQFCDTEVLKHFVYLFYVSCRFAKEKETILNMIKYQLFGDDDKMTVARYVLQHHPDLCLIVVDGLDEWVASPSTDTGRMGDIVGLPGLEGVEDCFILMTTRPWRFRSMSSPALSVFKRLRIEGINNVEQLAEQILQELEPEESAEEFLVQVEDKNMSDLMHIPLILIISLEGWVKDKSLHKSLCINYINIIQSLIRRSQGRDDWSRSELRQFVPNLDELEVQWRHEWKELPHSLSRYKCLQRYAGLFLSLGHLAFDLLLGKEEQSLVFSETVFRSYLRSDDENDETIKVCLVLGILTKTETTTRGLMKLESYAFCHKTFQEFFAALWLASKYQTEKTKFYQCIKTVKNLQGLEILIRFLCGFDSVTGKDFWIYVTEEVEVEKDDLSRVGRWGWQWRAVQELACTCMKEHEEDMNDQTLSKIHYCMPHIMIGEYTSVEVIMLLCHVMEEYYSSVKSVRVFYCQSQQHVQNICKSISLCSGLQMLKISHSRRGALCIPVIDLRLMKHNKLENLELKNTYVEGLLLPVKRATITSLVLDHVTITHHGMEQLAEFLSFCISLLNVDLMTVRCSQHVDGVCIPVLDIENHNKLEKLWLSSIPVECLLLHVEETTIASLKLDNVTMSHHGLEQLMKSMLSRSCPAWFYLRSLKCSEHTDNVCIPVMCLTKSHNLKKLELNDMFVEHLPLPVDCARTTSLKLCNVILSHNGLKQLGETSFSLLENLHLKNVKCREHSIGACIPFLDLQKQKNLKQLILDNISTEALLLPVEIVSITSMGLFNLTITHHGLEQVEKFVTFCPGLKELDVRKVKCVEHGDTVCIPVLDLHKHNNLKRLVLDTISVECLLLPKGEATIKSLVLSNLTITHHSLEQIVKFVSFCPGLEYLVVRKVKCVEHIDTVCIPVLDLQKLKHLKQLVLDTLSVESLLLLEGEATITSLCLYNLKTTHHSLGQIVKYMKFCPGLEKLDVQEVKCVEHDDRVCIPVLDLQKLKHLKQLMLDTISVEGLLLSEEGATITSLGLYNLTITHQSLEQFVKCMSFCPGLEELDVRKVKCVEHDDTVCIPVLDLLKHNNLKQLRLNTLSVESLLLPEGESTITSLCLYNLKTTHHSLGQIVKYVKFCLGLEKLDVQEVKCVEHYDTVCISVLDLQKQNNLTQLRLDTIPVESLLLPEEGATITSLGLYYLTITHQSLEQIVKCMSFFPGLVELVVRDVKCVEHGDIVCIPVLDLQTHNKLNRLLLHSIYFEGLLLPGEGATITSLWLDSITMAHHGLEQLGECLSFASRLVNVNLNEVRCSHHADGVCIAVLNLQKHKKLKKN